MINPHVKVYPLDEANAECVIAPFEHPDRSQLIQVDLHPGESVTAARHTQWDRTRFVWKRQNPSAALILKLTMPCRITLRHFDRFVACFWAAPTLNVSLTAVTDAGEITIADGQPGTGGRMEVEGRIDGTELREVRVTLSSTAERESHFDIVWFGLANAESVARAHDQRPVWSPDWPGCWADDAELTKASFFAGLLFKEEDLSRLKEKMTRPIWRDTFASLQTRVEKCRTRDIESEVGLYALFSDTRYSRAREGSRVPFYLEGMDVGFAALMTDDEELVRLAVRYLLCIAHTRHWYISAEHNLWGDAWDQRCFVEEMMSTACAVLFDWFGNLLNPPTREYILRSLWDKGLAVIQRDLMKWDYMHHINQAPWFCRASILGGLVLEKAWPHVGNFVDRAAEMMRQDMNRYILEDGGVDEGVGYFAMTWQTVMPAAIVYNRVRGKNLADWLPPQSAKSENYIASMSGSKPGTLLLDGDNTSELFRGDGAAMLAGVYPNSVYHKLLAEALKEKEFSYYEQYMNTGMFGLIFGPETVEPSTCTVPTFSLLSHTGHATSRRHTNGHALRIHFAGSKARPSHSHYDKGAITVEVDDDIVLIDRGTVRYDDWRATVLIQTQFHNVLTPAAIEGEFPQQQQPPVAMIPRATGDESQFNAQLDLKPVWREWFTAIERSVDSPNPAEFTVADTGRLAAPGRVVFHLHATRPFEIGEDEISIAASIGRLIITAPWANKVHQAEDLINHNFKPVWHLQIESGDLQSFDLRTSFRVVTK